MVTTWQRTVKDQNLRTLDFFRFYSFTTSLAPMLPSTPPTHSVVKRVVSNSVNKLPDLMTCPLHKGDQGGNSIELLTERNVKLYTKKKLEELNFLGSDVVALVCEDCRQAGILHQQSAWFKPDKRVGCSSTAHCRYH